MQQRLTIAMIEGKDFKLKPRGYDQKEVDTFLDDVCDEIERLEKLVLQLQQQVTALQQENDMLRQQGPTEDDVPAEAEIIDNSQEAPAPQAVQAIFDEAVRFRDQSIRESEARSKELIEAAQNEAAEIRATVEKEAEERLSAVNEEHERLSRQIDSLRQAAAEYREAFLRMLDQQKAALDQTTDLYE